MFFVKHIYSLILVFLLALFLSSVPKVYANDPCDPIASAPLIYQVNRTSTQATLFITPLNDQVINYTIIYGLSSGDERYSTTFDSGPTTGAISYTINSLQPGVTYFYKARGNTSCVSSPWSNWVSDKGNGTVMGASSSATRLPVTGSESVITTLSLSLGTILLGILLYAIAL